ncbi:MAG: sugar phosphate isomerase/epimerase [Clostridia bacterium]|nr:sugar phosphate isomerase/epimerase [Clostridia bacterium]
MSLSKRQIGGYLPAHAKTELHDRLRLFREAGFDFLALSMGGIYANNENSVTPRLAEKYGFEIDNVHLTGAATNQLWRDCIEAEDVLDRYCREIELCAKMGIKIGITHVTWGSHAPTPEITQLGVERFKRIADCAEKNDFCLALENSVTSEHLTTVLDAIDSPHIGFCFDSGHWACFTPDYPFMDRYAHRMVTMHLDDNDGIEDFHLLPYDGVANWDEIKKELRKTEVYSRKVLLEVDMCKRRFYPGMTAAEIRALWEKKGVAIAGDAHLIKYGDGYVDSYKDLAYDEYLDRAYRAALRIAQD